MSKFTTHGRQRSSIARPKRHWDGRLRRRCEDGQIIGVGSGSTSYLAIQAIAERVRREKLRVDGGMHVAEVDAGLCSGRPASLRCCRCGRIGRFDGADEVDPERNLIKGRGGAMFMEKILM